MPQEYSMQFTTQDFADFTRFVTGKLKSGPANSIVDLAQEWEAERREFEETVAELRTGIADMEAGKGLLFSESIAALRKKLNIPQGTK